MVGFAQSVGRLHASTLDRRAELTTGDEAVRRWDVVEQACAELGFPDARAARTDIAFVCSQLAEPGPYAAVTHNDLNPTNALVTDEGVRLVDFEGSGFGHIGFDVSFLHYPFPHHSANWAVLPESVTAAADRAYRSVVAVDGYDEMLAVGAAVALASRVIRLPVIARTDQTPYDSWRRRAQLVQQIGVFHRLTDRDGILPDLANWFDELAAAMTERWPDATEPAPQLYPAFA
jgi:Ser/Thr protein kinase RdoA (MazF antagonist)